MNILGWRRNAASRRVRTPTVLQMEAVECGAAALGIVLAHYGRRVALEKLRVECGVSRDGSKASNVVAAARRQGLTASGYRREPADLQKMTLPLIVFWNFNHFLVVEGFGPDKVYLNDPASGPRQVTAAEFDQAFTGVVLEMKPGPDFQPGGDDPSLLRSAFRRLDGSWDSVVLLVLIGLLLVVPGLLVPIFSRIFIDEYLIARHDAWVRPLLLGMAVTAVVRALLAGLQTQVLTRLRTKLAVAHSSRFLWHVLRLPVVFFTQRSAGEISSRVVINSKVASLMAGDVAAGVLAVLMVVFYAALMLVFDPALTALTVAVAGATVGILRLAARQRADASLRAQLESGRMGGVSMNGLRSIESLKATGTDGDFFAKWAGHHAKATNAQQQLAAASTGLMMLPGLLAALNSVLILAFGGLRVMDGTLSIGSLVAFQSLAASFIAPVIRLMDLSTKVQELGGHMKRLDDVLNYPIDPSFEQTKAAAVEARPSPAPTGPARLEGELELREVSFGFSPLEPPLIEGLNLRIRPGMRVALVGPSGCGKSTLSKLVTGLYQPWSGQILFDGRPRSEIAREVMHQSLAIVDQDIMVFEGSLRENLTMWDETIPEHQIVQAARDAHIHDVIASRTGGYDSRVQEGGGNFSGGQLQRLELARALVQNPSILVLDEATSALDPVSEQIVEDNLRRRGCTCLIVAHRLSSIRDCDEIIVLERGKVVQRGTHDEMKAVDGPYRRLMGEI